MRAESLDLPIRPASIGSGGVGANVSKTEPAGQPALQRGLDGERIGLIGIEPAPKPGLLVAHPRTVIAAGITSKVAGMRPGDSPSMSSKAALASRLPCGSTTIFLPRRIVQEGSVAWLPP